MAAGVRVLPVLGAGRPVRRARGAELAKPDGGIRRERQDALDGSATDSRLSHLVAREARVQAVSTGPFGVGGSLRFGLGLVVGRGSRLGAALVERPRDAALG